MSIAAKLRRAPGRIVTGAYILNSGIAKTKADEQTAQYLHGVATVAYPFLKRLEPKKFTSLLSAGEIAVGSLLLLPIVPAGLAGLALIGFSGMLVGLYVRTPGVHDEKLRPQGEGIALAKDFWMLGIGSGLVIDAALSESPITRSEL